MSGMRPIELEKKVSSLTENQFKIVFARLLEYLERDAPISPEEDEEQIHLQEKILLNNIADKLEIEENSEISEREVAKKFLITVYEICPQYRTIIDNIIMETEAESVTLDFGITLALMVIIPAIAVAIVRPSITKKKVWDKKNNTYTEEIVIASNSQDIASIIKSVFPFI